MIYARHYVQYENLVFDEIGMVSEDTTTVRFKSFSSEYTFRHGNYSPQKSSSKLLAAGSVSMTVTLNMKKLPCDVRPFFPRFAKAELTRAMGRLWAVQSGELVWAWAEPVSYREMLGRFNDTVEFDLNFELPEGVWHKADKLRTFLIPYDPCLYMDCYDFKELNPCDQVKGDCCDCGAKEPVEQCDCCNGNECDHVTERDALCFIDDLTVFYDCDPAGYKILVDCVAAERFFGDPLGAVYLGQKFCETCGTVISGRLYSDTDIPTSNIKITLRGKVHNPYIEINGNGNIIEGDYEGVLEIYPDGTIYNYTEGCGRCDPLPVSVWVIPEGMKYGWTVHQGYNQLLIDPGTCCAVCAYIEIDSLTY